MANWESRADRGGRAPNQGRGQRGQRGQRQSYTATPRETSPPPNPPVAQKPPPKGSPIAKKLARSSAPAWSAATIPELAVQVRAPSAAFSAHTLAVYSPAAQDKNLSRPHSGTAAPHRGPLVPRAGSSAYWGSRLAAFQSERRNRRNLWSPAKGLRLPRSSNL